MLQLPFFYITHFDTVQKSATLDAANSRHIVQVLRMQPGERLHLTDGLGHLITAIITQAHKHHCEVQIEDTIFKAPSKTKITVGISLLKNANRFEWFLEKATEIGITAIVPLLCEHTEKEKIKQERLQNILVSAMLQSRQVWLPKCCEPVNFEKFITDEAWRSIPQKLIAHCLQHEKKSLQDAEKNIDTIILIGPEGDFSGKEIEQAIEKKFQPVALGETRLRSETAAIVAAAVLVV